MSEATSSERSGNPSRRLPGSILFINKKVSRTKIHTCTEETDDQTVIRAYAMSLRMTFLCFALLAVVLCLLLLPVSIPDLLETKSEEVQRTNNEESRGDEGSP